MTRAKLNEQIVGIRRLALEEIPTMLKANGNKIIVDQYRQKRIELNMALIQVLIGGSFVKKGEVWNVKFNGRIPNRTELAEITKILDNFVKTVEQPVMNAISDAGASNDDSMDIPPRGGDFGGSTGLPKLEKLNSKKMKSYIFGSNGNDPLYHTMLSVADCMEIAAMGESLRKKRNRNMMLMVGGVVLLVTGVTVAAVCICKRNKKNEQSIDDICDDCPIDMDAEDDGFAKIKM